MKTSSRKKESKTNLWMRITCNAFGHRQLSWWLPLLTSLVCCVVAVPLPVASVPVGYSVDAVGHKVYPSGLIEAREKRERMREKTLENIKTLIVNCFKENWSQKMKWKQAQQARPRKGNWTTVCCLLKYEVNKNGEAMFTAENEMKLRKHCKTSNESQERAVIVQNFAFTPMKMKMKKKKKEKRFDYCKAISRHQHIEQVKMKMKHLKNVQHEWMVHAISTMEHIEDENIKAN